MATGKDEFLYEDDLDAVFAIIEADMLQNDDEMESEIEKSVSKASSNGDSSFRCQLCPKICISKGGLTRHMNSKHMRDSQELNNCSSEEKEDSSSAATCKLELAELYKMYERSTQKLAKDECYPESVMEEFKNFKLSSLEDIKPHYELILPTVNSFSGDLEIFYPQMYNVFSTADDYTNLSHDCSLLLSFDVVNQIVAHITGANVHNDILVFQNSDIATLSEKDNSIISYLSGYVFGTFYRRLRFSKSKSSTLYHQQCLSFLMAGKCSGESLPLPEHTHVQLLDRGGLWKVNNYVTSIFQVAECHFKNIAQINTTKIDAPSLVSTLIKNPFIQENVSFIRNSSPDIIKKEIAYNLLEDLLTLYIRVRAFSFVKDQIQSHKIKKSRSKSSSL